MARIDRARRLVARIPTPREDPPARDRRTALRTALPWVLLLAGAAFPLARVLLHPTALLPGSEVGDVYKHAWAYWHALIQIAEGTWPATRYLGAPEGGTLLDVMLLPAIFMAPVTLTAGPVAAANVWVLLSLLAVGGSVYALSRALTGSMAASLCAGLISQSAPFLMGHALTSGVHERLAVWVFPLTLLCLLRIRQQGGARWLALAAGGQILATSQCPTYGVFSGVLLLMAAPLVFKPQHQGRRRLARLRPMIGAYLVLGASLVGIFLVQSWFIHQPDFLAGIPESRITPSFGVGSLDRFLPLEYARLDMLFDPRTARAELPSNMDDELYHTVYWGWVPLLTTLAGLILAWVRRRWDLVGVVTLGLIFGVLAMGPTIDVLGSDLVNPPFYLLSYLVPFYGGLPTIWQQVGILGPLAAVGTAHALAALPGPRQRAVAAALVILAVLGERLYALPMALPIAPANARISRAYDVVKGEGALVDIPRIYRDTMLSRGEAFLAQTQHGRPITRGINIGLGILDNYLPVARGGASSWTDTATCLRANGIRWVVIHGGWFADVAAARACAAGFSKAAGPPVANTGDEMVYDLERVASGGVDPISCIRQGSPGGEAYEPPVPGE